MIPFPRNTPQDESLTYQGQLDRLEAELLKYRAELSSMQSINSNALQSKEEAKVDRNTGNGFILVLYAYVANFCVKNKSL